MFSKYSLNLNYAFCVLSIACSFIGKCIKPVKIDNALQIPRIVIRSIEIIKQTLRYAQNEPFDGLKIKPHNKPRYLSQHMSNNTTCSTVDSHRIPKLAPNIIELIVLGGVNINKHIETPLNK